jgi:hypothetical protein
MKRELTPLEHARERGVTIDWVYRELRLGKIPATRRGRRWIIQIPDLSREGAAQETDCLDSAAALARP